MSRTATAAVIHEAGGGFSLETIELDELQSNELLVKVEASGVCHTDAVAQGILPLPAVLGHEGVGIVEAVGGAVTRFRPGDRVIMSYASCGDCPCCNGDKAYICDSMMPLNFGGSRIDGTHTISLNNEPITSSFFQQSSFSTHAIAVEQNVVKVTGDHQAEMLAALPCGVQTGAGAILNTLGVGPKDSLAVFGTGAVGMSGLMAAKLAGAFPIIAIDINDERLELARELGAHHLINAKDGEVAARIREIVPRGVDFSFETSANEQALNDAIACLVSGGECGSVSAPHAFQKYPFSPTEIMIRAASLRGIIQGSATPKTFLPRLIELQKQGLFPYERLITTYDFADINQAFADSASGKTIKPVLKING